MNKKSILSQLMDRFLSICLQKCQKHTLVSEAQAHNQFFLVPRFGSTLNIRRFQPVCVCVCVFPEDVCACREMAESEMCTFSRW